MKALDYFKKAYIHKLGPKEMRQYWTLHQGIATLMMTVLSSFFLLNKNQVDEKITREPTYGLLIWLKKTTKNRSGAT